MPKSGKDRRSARDQVRAPDQGGGLGSDEDYDWIRYLGEGRASSSAVLPLVQPAARPVTQAAARPATLPARSRQDAAPVRERRPGRSAARTESAARANRSGLPPAGYAAEREPPSPADRAPLPRADRAPLPRADRVPLPPADRPSRPSRPPRPTAGPAVRLTAGRPVDLASGRETDLLFNPAADDYGQPLYPEPGSRPGRQQARPDLDWPDPDPGLPYPDRQERDRQERGRADRGRADRGRADRGRADRGRPDRGRPDRGRPDRGRPERDRAERDRPERDRPERDRAERDRPERDRPERDRPDARLDTAEYARPLYPPQDASPAAPARRRRSEPADALADTDARRGVPGDRRSAGRKGRAGQTGPLPRRDRAARTGPQRRVDGLERADQATDTSPGPHVAGLTGSAAMAGVARGDAAAIADVAHTAGAGQRGGQAGAGASPEIGLLDRQLRYRGKPPRKPRKPEKPARPGRTGGPRPGPGKIGGPRPGPGKGRSRAGQRVSRNVLAVGLAAGVAVLAVAGYLLFGPQTPHAISAPATLGSYIRQQENATAEALKHRIVTAARGDVKNVVAAVYDQKTGTSAGPQVVVFIGGNLAGSASASDLISAYMTQLHGAFTTSAGKLGGQAACAPGSNGGPAECAWADNDTFGVVVSATLKSAALAAEMRLMRPQVEHVVK